MIKQACEPDANLLALAFVEAMMSIGFYVLRQCNPESSADNEIYDAQKRLGSALGWYKTVQGCPNSLLKLQTMLILVGPQTLHSSLEP